MTFFLLHLQQAITQFETLTTAPSLSEEDAEIGRERIILGLEGGELEKREESCCPSRNKIRSVPTPGNSETATSGSFIFYKKPLKGTCSVCES